MTLSDCAGIPGSTGVQYDHACMAVPPSAGLLEDTWCEHRWAEYSAATALGVRSSLSVPMRAHGHAPGALNLYADRPDVFGHREVGRAGVRAGAFGPSPGA